MRILSSSLFVGLLLLAVAPAVASHQLASAKPSTSNVAIAQESPDDTATCLCEKTVDNLVQSFDGRPLHLSLSDFTYSVDPTAVPPDFTHVVPYYKAQISMVAAVENHSHKNVSSFEMGLSLRGPDGTNIFSYSHIGLQSNTFGVLAPGDNQQNLHWSFHFDVRSKTLPVGGTYSVTKVTFDDGTSI